MNDCHKDDSSKRHKLNEVLSECQDKLNEFDVPETGGRRRGSSAIEDLLKTEGTANNFKLEFNDRIKSIGSGECAIVISGTYMNVLCFIVRTPMNKRYLNKC